MKKIVLCVLVSLLVVSLAWATEKVPVIQTTIKAPAYTPNKDDVLNEGFEGGVLPTGWTQEYVNGTIDWQYQNGGYSGNPSSAHTGSYNALFYYDSYDGYSTKLVTPEINLGAKTDYTLTFWHAQVNWGSDQDTLRVYYKTSAAGAWTLLEEYTTSVLTWTERTIDLLNPCSTYYIAFEGSQDYGYGVCIDDVSVAEAAPPGQSETYGWEDGIATALGFYGNAVFENSTEQAYEGTHSLKFIEDPISGTPQAYIWWVTGLTDGDVIDASFWVYDFNDVASYPKGRIWAHYTSDPDSIDSYAGSAGGNDDYSTIGWSHLSHSWTFDSDGGTRDGFVVEARIYSSSTPGENVLYIDSTAITVSSDTAIIYHPSPPTQDIVVTVTVDNYPSEASWNVWDYTNLSWYYPANQTFTTSGETQIDTLALADGNYAVYCWDTYGDGGIGGIVTNMGVVLVQWASTDYTLEGIFDFLVYQLEYGSLAGYVTEFSLKTPIEGANIVCGDYEGFSGPDGYYQIDDILVGTYDVTCEAEGYNVAIVEDIEITVDDTTYQDFALTAPTMDIDDTPIVVEVLMNSTNDDNFITIENNGNGPLDWNATIPLPDRLEIALPAYIGTPPLNTNRLSVEFDDGGNSGSTAPHNQPMREILRGSTAWFRGGEYATYFYGTFDTDTPGDMTEILSPPAWSAYCGDYSTESDDYFYINNPDDFNIYTIDAVTGVATLVGPTGLSEFFNGIACDKTDGTMYAVNSSSLYTIDLSTGAATLVGPIGNTGGVMLTLACDGNGDLWGIDLAFDTFWWIDKTTGAGTEIGPTGFNCNYAQSMAWDPETDVIYWAAYGGGLDGHLRVIDKTTGNSAFVGDFEGGREVTVLAFPGGAGPSWLALDPFSGTIPPGGSGMTNVIFDATGIDPGTTLNADIIFTSDPDVGSVSVPVEMTVYFPENYVLEGFEDTDFPPFDWLNPDGYWSRLTNNAYQGDGYARVNWTHPRDANLISPFLNIASGDIISFYWINANLYDNKFQRIIGEDTLFVEISNDIFDPDGWETLIALSAEEEMEEYEEVIVNLPDMYIGNQARVRFRHRSYESAESRGVGLDNILMPEPFYPINFYVDPEEQADYDSLGATVEYSIDVYNTGIQSDRYNLSIVGSRTSRDVEDFEDDDGGYIGTGQWQWGTPTSGPGNAHSGVNVWATNLSGDYNTNSNYTLDSPESVLADDASLNFWHWYDTEASYDGGNVKISTDGGATWTVIEPIGGYPGMANTSNPLYPEPIFCGHGQGFWENVEFDLSAYVGETASFRWHFGSDSSVQYPGWYIDDVDIPGNGGPGPGPAGWPASVSVPYIDVNPGEFGTFSVLVNIPEDAVEDDVNTTTVLVESREAPHIYHEADVITTAHPKDPYEPNDNFTEATPIDYAFVSNGAQIYYNAYYFDEDIDIYTFDGLEGDVIYTLFDIADTLLFDGAIVLLDADSTMLAYADSYAGGVSEALQYRLLNDGTFYVKLGVWYEVLEGPFKKTIQRTETTTYYTMSLELIPSPGVLVEPPELTLGIIQNGKDTASDILYITNTGDEGAINLDWDIEILMPGIEILLDEGFEGDFPPDGWQNIMITGHAWEQSPAYAHSGTYSAKYTGTSSGGTGELITLLVDLTLCENDILSFHIKNKVWAGDQNVCYLYISTDGGTIWTLIHTFDTDMPNFEYWEFDLESYDQTDNTFIKFVGEDNYGYGIYIDDVYMATGEAWAFADPEAGSVPQGATRTSTITCDDDAKGLDPGVYYADIIVHNNALLQGVSDVIVPLTLYVGESSGGLEGTVTFITTGDPIDSVEVSCGNFVAYTDTNGFYQFDPAPPVGIYNVKFEKPGFVTAWADSVQLGYWVTVLDMQMYFDGPSPTDLVAEGLHLCIDLTWRAPSTGGTTQVEYILDDGSYENGWTGNPGYELWFGNLFPVDDTGELISFDLYTEFNAAAGTDQLEIDIFDSAHNLVGSSNPFVPIADTWTTISCPNVPFSGEFYALIHFDFELAQSNWIGYDENGPNANAGLDWYTDGTVWQLFHVAAATVPGVFMLRATAIVQGELTEITVGDIDYTPGLLSGHEITSIQNSVSMSNFNNPQYIIPNIELNSYEITINRDDLVLDGYNVYREDVSATVPYDYVSVEDPRYYRDEIVAVGIEYTYWVTAVYTVGESAPSNLASAIPIILNIEDFEIDDGGYTSNDPNGWQWGHATAGPPNAHSGENLWGTVLSGNYINSASWTLDTPEQDITIGNCLLLFSHWYNTENSWDGGNVKISTNNGVLWTVIIPEGGYPDDAIVGLNNEPGYTANSGGWVDAVFDLSGYIGETALLRWHFGTDSSVPDYPGWYIDDVQIGLGIEPDYGALQGTVTDPDGFPIEDAQITVMGALHPLGRYSVETNEFGYYEVDPIIAQFYEFTCECFPYYTVEDTFTVFPDSTLVFDVVMGIPEIIVTPPSVTITLNPNTQGEEYLTVSNPGTAPLEWYANIEFPEALIIDIPPSSGDFQRDKIIPSTGIDLGMNNSSSLSHFEPSIELLRGSTAWFRGGEYSTYFYGTFDTDTPGTMNEILSPPAWSAYCGDYSTESEDYFYINNPDDFNTYTVDAASGIATLVGPTGLSDFLNGMACDKTDGTMYAVDGNNLYTINLTTGAATLVGPIGTGGTMLTLACDGNGDLWGIDLVLDTFWWIDKTTGAGTEIGPTGFDCNYAQSMAWDPETDVIYWAAYGGGLDGNLRVIDKTTGNSAFVGDFEGGREVTVLAFQGSGTPPWIWLSEYSGIVPAGGDSLVTVYFDAIGQVAGTILNADIHFFSPVGEPIIPATLIVYSATGDLDGTVTDAGTGDPLEGVLVTALAAEYTTYTDSIGYYLFEAIPTGMYNVTFEYVGYNVGFVDSVEIFENLTTTVDYAMTSPELIFTPISFDFTIEVGNLDTDTLYVENVGTGPVDFFIDIDYITDTRQTTILCVDRDGSSSPAGYTDDWPYFEAALIAAGYTDYTHYDVVDLTQDGPDLATMLAYEVIIWFSGEAWGYYGHDCMTDNDEINLGIYLEGGGSLFLSAQDYLWASYPSAGPDNPFSPGQFPYDYLGLRIIDQDKWFISLPSTGTVAGVDSSLAEGYIFDVQDIYTTSKEGLFIDEITNHVGLDMFNMTSPDPEGICANQYDSDLFRTVFTTASFAAITEPTIQDSLIKDIIVFLTSGMPHWLTVEPMFGTFPTTTTELLVTANAEELGVGEYNATITVNTENPDIGDTVISVHLEVIEISVDEIHYIQSTKLNSNFPNPFSNSTTISFSLKEKSHVKLSVYNIKGQLVATLIDDMMNPVANYEIVWNGKNGRKQLANGIYFYRFDTKEKTFIKKMLILR